MDLRARRSGVLCILDELPSRCARWRHCRCRSDERASNPRSQRRHEVMIDRVEERFGIKPERLIGDMAYGSAEMLAGWWKRKRLSRTCPCGTKLNGPIETFSRSDFRWNEQADEYRCPRGRPLRREWRRMKRPRTHITKSGTIIYRASQPDCAGCPLKHRCCPNTPMRKIARSIHEQARDVAREWPSDLATGNRAMIGRKSRCCSRTSSESLKLDRLRLRGITGARDEFLLAAIAQNLRRMARRLCPTVPPTVLTYTS